MKILPTPENVSLIKRLHIDENKSLDEIGTIFNCGQTAVSGFLRRQCIQPNQKNYRTIAKVNKYKTDIINDYGYYLRV